MTATVPLWATILLSTITPVLALAGVLWTQRAADRRAELEARLRVEQEQRLRWDDRRREAYIELHNSLHRLLWQIYDTDQPHDTETQGQAETALTATMLVGTDQVYEAGRRAWQALMSYHKAVKQHGLRSPEVDAAGNDVRRLFPKLLTTMERELVPAAPDAAADGG